MDGRKRRHVQALDGWGTCELKVLMEDIARWKGKRWRLQFFTDTDGARAAFVLNTHGTIAYQLSPRRTAAAEALWDDIPADRHDEREG